MRSKMLAVAIAAGLGVTSFATMAAPAPQQDQVTVSASELEQLKAEIAALQKKVDDLQAQQGAQAQTVQQVQAKQQAIEAMPANESTDKLAKLVNDTSIGGKMYFDFSNIDQKNSDSGKTDATGTGLDVKRFYLSVTHNFNDIWSANLTTDFNYVSSDGETNLFVKKVYVQGKFSDAATLRIGSADMPWIPFVEGLYGFRYVENTITDRLHYANSADWGLHMLGNLGGKTVNYQVSVVNGGGYKHPGRTQGVDVEGRVGFSPFDGMMVAVGGYSGHLGNDTQNINAYHTAQRGDLLVAYANNGIRVGGEYFTAKDWNNVLSPLSDKADGYSFWGSVEVAPKVTLFARYDSAKLSKDLDHAAKDTYYNLGVQYEVTKGFQIAGVWKHEKGDKTVAAPVPTHVQNVKTDEIGVFGQVAF